MGKYLNPRTDPIQDLCRVEGKEYGIAQDGGGGARKVRVERETANGISDYLSVTLSLVCHLNTASGSDPAAAKEMESTQRGEKRGGGCHETKCA